MQRIKEPERVFDDLPIFMTPTTTKKRIIVLSLPRTLHSDVFYSNSYRKVLKKVQFLLLVFPNSVQRWLEIAYFFYHHKLTSGPSPKEKDIKDIQETLNILFILKFGRVSSWCNGYAMDCWIVEREFILQSCYYVHFRANTLGKGMNPLIFPAMGKQNLILKFIKQKQKTNKWTIVKI